MTELDQGWTYKLVGIHKKYGMSVIDSGSFVGCLEEYPKYKAGTDGKQYEDYSKLDIHIVDTKLYEQGKDADIDIDFSEFDNIEIHPLWCTDENGNNVPYEKATTHEVASYDDDDIGAWGLYGHLKTGGVENIADYKTEANAIEAAELFVEFLNDIAGIDCKIY